MTDAEAALRPGAPLLHEDAPDNLCVDWELGDRAAVEEALAAAAHRISLETRNQRVIVCPWRRGRRSAPTILAAAPTR